MLRNILAPILGILIGSFVNMAIITIGPIFISPPDGIDMSDMDRFAENLQLLEPIHFIPPWLAHALGTLVGAAIASAVAFSHKFKFATGVGLFFLCGGIMMVLMFGGPTWFICVDLIAAYLPMAYLGGLLGRASSPPS